MGGGLVAEHIYPCLVQHFVLLFAQLLEVLLIDGLEVAAQHFFLGQLAFQTPLFGLFALEWSEPGVAHGAVDNEEHGILVRSNYFESAASLSAELLHSAQNLVAIVTHFILKVREQTSASKAGQFPTFLKYVLLLVLSFFLSNSFLFIRATTFITRFISSVGAGRAGRVKLTASRQVFIFRLCPLESNETLALLPFLLLLVCLCANLSMDALVGVDVGVGLLGLLLGAVLILLLGAVS